MKINKITLYQLPFTFSSGNRSDVYESYEKLELTDSKLWSYNIQSMTNMTLSINDSVGNAKNLHGFTYAKIESDIFPGKTTPNLYFLTNVTKVNSGKSVTYNVRLDVFTSFKTEFFGALEGQTVNVKRMHEDRWVKDGNSWVINTNSHFLLNSDFSVPDTKGMELKYSYKNALIYGARDNELSSLPKPFKRSDLKIMPEYGTSDSYVPYWERTFGNKIIPIENLEISSYSDIHKQRWYIYAVLNNAGNPKITLASDLKYDSYSLAIVQPHLPISGDVIADASKMSSFENMQEGKIVNMIISPFPIDSPEVQSSPGQLSYNNLYIISYKDDGTLVPNGSTDAKHSIYITLWSRDQIATGGIGHDTTNPYNSARVEPLKLDEFGFVESSTDLNSITNSEDPILLNQSIAPISFRYKDNEIVVDIYNYIKNPIIDKAIYHDGTNNKKVILGSFNVTPEGVYGSLNISKNQFMDFSDTSYYSYYTNSGSTYLAQNKNTIDGNKKLIGLQMQKEQIEMSKNYGSGVSLFNPVSWFKGATDAGLDAGAQYLASQIKDQETENINNGIRDAYATAPNAHLGNDNEAINRHIKENLKGKFNFIMKMPNARLKNNILYFANKFGYKIDDYMKFEKAKMIDSRNSFNYIQISDVKSSIDFNLTSASNHNKKFNFNYGDILDEFSNILEQGVRIWHTSDVDYDPKKNFEKILN